MDRRAPYVLLLVWVALAPILWGSVAEVGHAGDGWLSQFRAAGGSYGIFRVLGYLSLALLIPSLLGMPGGTAGTRTGGRLLLLLLLLIATAAIQLVPLPVGLYSLLAPGHARDLSVLLPEAGWAPISTDPGLTGRAAVHLFLLLAAALVVYHTVRTPRRAWILTGTIVGVAVVGGLYGIYESHLGGDLVLGQAKGGTGGGVTGTFFYRGNFAAFTAAALAMAAAAAVWAFHSGRRVHAGFAVAACLVLGPALLLSLSRAGLAAGGLAVVVGIWFAAKNRRLAMSLIGVSLVLAVIVCLSYQPLRDRFLYFSGEGSRGHADVRLAAWPPTLRLAAGRPVLGSGLGTYRRAIHLTQSEDIPLELYFAHSDPLNVLAEAGAFGLLVVVTMGIMGFMVALRLSRDREHPGAGPGAACVGGLTAFVAMACVDFPLQIPATSLVFTVLLIVPVALRAERHPAARSVGSRRNLARFAAAAGFILLCWGVLDDYRRGLEEPGVLTRGEARYERGRRRMADGDLDSAKADLMEARRLQPFEGATRLYLAQTLYHLGDYEGGRREVRATYHLSRGRAVLLFSVGRFSLLDRTLADLTVKSFREASILEARFFPEVLKLEGLSPAMLLEIVPDVPHLLRNLARHLKSKGHTAEASEAARRAEESKAR